MGGGVSKEEILESVRKLSRRSKEGFYFRVGDISLYQPQTTREHLERLVEEGLVSKVTITAPNNLNPDGSLRSYKERNFIVVGYRSTEVEGR